MNYIYIGESKDKGTYTDPDLKKCSGILAVAMDIDQLSIDEFTFTVCGGGSGLYQYNNIRSIPYGEPIWWYKDSTLIGKFYFDSITRTGKTDLTVLCTSFVGILDKQVHKGGVYTGATFATVIADIIDGAISYTVEANVQSVTIYGWIPFASKRANLHQLLFAVGANVKKDASGNPVFYFETSNTIKTIPDARVFLGGKISYRTPATRVEVSEHTFAITNDDEDKVLFDNTQEIVGANNVLVKFAYAPCHDLSVTGTLTIVESGVNYAIVTGQGTLSGKVYTHQTKITEAINGDATGSEQVYSVSDATLVSLMNGQNVAKRILNYVTKATTVNAEIVLNDEKTGDLVQITDANGESIQAFISQMELQASSFIKAECRLIRGYIPTAQGNNYSNSVVLTGSGTWTVPADVDTIVCILISGGQGGQAGYNGGAGGRGQYNGASAGYEYYGGGGGGNGGSAGNAGNGGRVFQQVKSVTPGDVLTYACGQGGAGGASGGAYGSDGTDTTFDDLSTSGATALADQTVDMFSGITYGGDGALGVNGGKGGNGYFADGTDGADVGANTGGEHSNASASETHTAGSYSVTGTLGGAGGGGAAYGSNGGDATDAGSIVLYLNGNVNFYRKKGGTGANASSPAVQTRLGAGGNGGHGGGGGGGTGGLSFRGTYASKVDGSGQALGGTGSAGSDGADGVIIIYY